MQSQLFFIYQNPHQFNNGNCWMSVVKLDSYLFWKLREISIMCLLESSHHVFNTCSTEKVLLFYDVHLHFFWWISVLIEKNTCYSFCSLSCFYQINIIIICLAMKFVILFLKRWQRRPKSETVRVKSIISRDWSVISHCFHVFTIFPEDLLDSKAIDIFSFFS